MKLQSMSGMDETSAESGTASILDSIRDIVTSYNQQQILQANIDRAKQGLPPINTGALAPTYNVGLTPELKNMLIVGGIVLAVILLMKKGR